MLASNQLKFEETYINPDLLKISQNRVLTLI